MNPDMQRLDPGFDSRVADWLEADPDRAPGEVLDTILAALPSVPQRRALRVPWRLPGMFANRLAIAALAIALVIAGGGFTLSRLTDQQGVGLGSTRPTPTSSSTPSSTLAPSSPYVPTITAAHVGTTLAAGTYQVDAFAAPFSVTFPTDWLVGELTPNNVVFRNGNDFFTLVVVGKVYRDPCHTEGGPTTIGPHVDDLVAALSAMTGFHVTGLKDATVGGAIGKSFTLANSIDLRADHCSRTDVLWIGTNEKAGEDMPVLETAGGADPLWAMDASGVTVLIGGPQRIVDAISFRHESPLAPPGPTASAGGLDRTFVSSRYGYSIDYPAGWSARPAMADPGTIDNPYVDQAGPSPFDELDCGPYPPGCGDPHAPYGSFFGVAARAPDGVTPEEWVVANRASVCPSELGYDTATIDGRTAFITEGGCPAGLAGYHYTAILATADRVYRFQLTSPEPSDPRFLQMLSSVHLVAAPPAS